MTRQQEYYLKNREKILLRQLAYRQRDDVKQKRREQKRKTRKADYIKKRIRKTQRVRALVVDARRRAKRLQIPFDDVALENFVINAKDNCACCSIDFIYGLGHSEQAPTIDKIHNSKGYVHGNIGLICRRCNRIKSDATVEDIQKILVYMG